MPCAPQPVNAGTVTVDHPQPHDCTVDSPQRRQEPASRLAGTARKMHAGGFREFLPGILHWRDQRRQAALPAALDARRHVDMPGRAPEETLHLAVHREQKNPCTVHCRTSRAKCGKTARNSPFGFSAATVRAVPAYRDLGRFVAPSKTAAFDCARSSTDQAQLRCDGSDSVAAPCHRRADTMTGTAGAIALSA